MGFPPKMKKFAVIGSGLCTLVGGVVIWKDRVRGDKLSSVVDDSVSEKDLQDKVYIVTGANTGKQNKVKHLMCHRN